MVGFLCALVVVLLWFSARQYRFRVDLELECKKVNRDVQQYRAEVIRQTSIAEVTLVDLQKICDAAKRSQDRWERSTE